MRYSVLSKESRWYAVIGFLLVMVLAAPYLPGNHRANFVDDVGVIVGSFIVAGVLLGLSEFVAHHCDDKPMTWGALVGGAVGFLLSAACLFFGVLFQ